MNEKIIEKLRDYASCNNDYIIIPEDITQCKYYLYYDEYFERIMIKNTWDSNGFDKNIVYFTSPKICMDAINEIGEDNLIKLFNNKE